jgi:hypothetical protein
MTRKLTDPPAAATAHCPLHRDLAASGVGSLARTVGAGIRPGDRFPRHGVSYALKKRVGAGLLEGRQRGKEVFFRTTPRGRDVCSRYRQGRETCLMPSFTGTPGENARLGDAASLLRTRSRRYDQAARAAAAARFTVLDGVPA